MFELQKSILYDDVEYPIRSDYRDILNIISAFEDDKLSDEDKVYVLWEVLFEDESPDVTEESLQLCMDFLNAGMSSSDCESNEPRLYSWKTDGAYIINAISKLVQKSIRDVEYLHWFDFVGFFSEIGESTFSTIVGIRQKKSKGKKLEAHEEEYYRNNRGIIDALQGEQMSLGDLQKLADLLQNK